MEVAADAAEERVGNAATGEEQEEGSSGQGALDKQEMNVQETTSKPMDIFEGERFDAVAFINRLFPDGMRACAVTATPVERTSCARVSHHSSCGSIFLRAWVDAHMWTFFLGAYTRVYVRTLQVQTHAHICVYM